jgi:hypothetical protein
MQSIVFVLVQTVTVSDAVRLISPEGLHPNVLAMRYSLPALFGHAATGVEEKRVSDLFQPAQ